MFPLKLNSHLSLQIHHLKQEYQAHSSMLQVQLLKLKLQEEKRQARSFYQSIKNQISAS